MGQSSNMVASVDEIEAALAELDKLAPAQAESIPSLDDASEAPEDAAPVDETPPETVAAPEPEADGPTAAHPAESGDAEPARASRWQSVSVTLERGLDKLDRPLVRFGDRVRNLVGVVALVTLVVSTAVAIAAPFVLPDHDPVTFVQEKRAQLDARLAAGVRGDGPLSTE